MIRIPGGGGREEEKGRRGEGEEGRSGGGGCSDLSDLSDGMDVVDGMDEQTVPGRVDFNPCLAWTSLRCLSS